MATAVTVNNTEYINVAQITADSEVMTTLDDSGIYNTTEGSANFTNYTYESASFSYDDMYYMYEDVTAFDNPFNIVHLIVCILGLTANIMSMIATAHIPHELTTHSKLIISLGVSDSLILIAALSHLLLYTTSWVHCPYIIKRVFQDTGLQATLLNLLAMALDHYLSIMKPMSYRRFMTNFRCNCFIMGIWIFGITIGLLEVIVGRLTEDETDDSFCLKISIDEFDSEIILTVFTFVVLSSVVIFYTRIYFVARNIIMRDQTLYQDNMHNYKAIITTMLIIGTFAILWIPEAIFKIYTHSIVERIDVSDMKKLHFVNDFLFLLLLSNSLADPLIYSTRLKEVQRGYKVLFYKMFPKRRFSTNEEEFRNQNELFCSKRRDTIHTFVNDIAGCSSPGSTSDKLSDFEKKFEESSFMLDHCCVQK